MANCKATFRAQPRFTKQQQKLLLEVFHCKKCQIAVKPTMHQNRAASGAFWWKF